MSAGLGGRIAALEIKPLLATATVKGEPGMGVLEIIFIMAGLGGRSGFAEITRQLATAKGEPGMQVLEIKSLLAGLGGRTAALEITL